MKCTNITHAHKRVWTIEEEQILINNYIAIGDAVAALLPNRTVKAIRVRAYKLGIKSPNSWTDDEDFIIESNGITYNDEMAKLLPNRTSNSIRLRCYYLQKKHLDKIQYPLNLYIEVYYSDKGYNIGATPAMFKGDVECILRSIRSRTDLGNRPEFGKKIATAMELHYKRNIKIEYVARMMNINCDDAMYLINRGVHLIKCVI